MTATAPPVFPGPIVVMGAGCVGAWMGGMLARAGAEVHLVGRPAVLGAIRAQGLTVSDLEGRRFTANAQALHLHEQVPTGLAPALVLLTVKSLDTAPAARALGAALPHGTVVLSFQNGVHNAERAQREAPGLCVLPGMVPYNIAAVGPAHWHRGTDGALQVQSHPGLTPWGRAFTRAGLPLKAVDDLRPVQWGKLLLNLNNPVNALSGMPLRAQLMDRDFRGCTADLMEEALNVLRAAGVPAARVSVLPPRWLVPVLRLPTPWFERLARRLLRIDAQARSSMADDLARGRPTEIDDLCGAVVALAAAHGVEAPKNRRMVALVRASGTTGRRWSGPDLREALGP